VGSVSSAVIVCRLKGLPDPRTQGSKNPGATNVLRLGGKRLAAITLLGDALKGFIPVVIAQSVDPSVACVAPVMVAAFLGHLYPLFFRFQGGKGVATAIGALLALSWSAGLLCIGTWGVVAYLYRWSSLAALVAAALGPVFVAKCKDLSFAFPVASMSLLLIWRHQENVRRLLKGVEPKMGERTLSGDQVA